MTAYKVKIQDLGKEQDALFEEAAKLIPDNPVLRDWLFDYLYNAEEDISWPDFMERYNLERYV